MPAGMLKRHDPIGRPNARYSTPACRRWAATESPFGPTPMIATSVLDKVVLLWGQARRHPIGRTVCAVRELSSGQAHVARQGRDGRPEIMPVHVVVTLAVEEIS